MKMNFICNEKHTKTRTIIHQLWRQFLESKDFRLSRVKIEHMRCNFFLRSKDIPDIELHWKFKLNIYR